MKKELIYKTFSKIPTLLTPRLTLRRLSPGDTDDMFEYASRTDVARFMTWYPHADRQFTRDYLEYLQSRYAAGMFYDWGIVFEPESKMVGTVGFTNFNITSDCGEIGYALNPAYEGKGIMTEAVNCVLEFGFETLNLHRIEGRFMAENKKSRSLLERVGMQFEGVRRDGLLIKGNFEDVGICAILVQDYLAQKQTSGEEDVP